MGEYERRMGEPSQQEMSGTVLTDPSQDLVERTEQLRAELSDRTPDGREFHDRLELGKEEAERIGKRVLDAMKQTWNNVSEKTPEFLKQHKNKIALGAGSFATARLVRAYKHRQATVNLPIKARTLDKITSRANHIKDATHERIAS